MCFVITITSVSVHKYSAAPSLQSTLLISKKFKLINTFILKKLQGKRHWNYESMPGTEVKFYKFDRKSYK